MNIITMTIVSKNEPALVANQGNILWLKHFVEDSYYL